MFFALHGDTMPDVHLYRDIAEKLLGRPLSTGDGFNRQDIEAGVNRFQGGVPQPLLDYYACFGAHRVNQAHDNLLAPGKLYIDVEETAVIFMHENQGVCSWGIRLEDLDSDDPVVFQWRDEDDWVSEECVLSEFLRIWLYLQCCWGGLNYTASSLDPAEIIPVIQRDWTAVVDHGGLVIWEDDGILISNMDDSLLLGATNDEDKLSRLLSMGFDLD